MKMTWLKRKLRNWLEEEIELERDCLVSSSSVSTSSEFTHRQNPIHFRIYDARGGKVLEVYRYDRKTDRENSSLYIVNNDENLGEEIHKIIFLEQL